MKELAESTLWELIDLEDRTAKSLEYGEMLEDLKHVAGHHPMTAPRFGSLRSGWNS